ncbi:hypothetical protein [Fluviicola sp.]|jgi:hypothetical protein|uniref:hypothetical protein n=1 Tax=Fluviicola sp. TaxID=1917219 RepID=UPI002816E0B1|nr:hypothetical protein [Fluviicola sp.]MDR0802930.1 hypothetical protein [Fluviicola sp.]
MKLERILANKWMIFLLFASVTYLFSTKTDRLYRWTNPGDQKTTPIYSDGAGYYTYLPEWFIYEGSNFSYSDSIARKYPDAGFEDNLSKTDTGKKYDKYFTGTAQCLTPFFLIGHAHAKIIGEDTDGYSWPYLIWLHAGMIFYVMLGLVTLFLFLRRLKIGYLACYVAVLSLALGTNLSYYVYVDIPYSHIFSFAMVNLCLLTGINWIQKNKTSSLLFFSFFLGLTFVIRPTNILILAFVPFLFATNKELISRIRSLFTKQWKVVLFGILLFGIPVFIQVYFFYLQMGEIRMNSYSSDEGFTNWKNPYMWEVLFGFRKGVFIYGPVLLLVIPGLVVMFFKASRLFFGILIFMLLSTYVLSSWWCWWYGGSLGFRAMVDFYGLWILPLAYLVHYAKVPGQIVIILCVFCSAWIYQTYENQQKKHILHYDYMNYPMWKKVFMKEDPRFCFIYYSDIDTIPETGKAIGNPVGFSVDGRLLASDRIYGFKGKDFYREVPYAEKLMKVNDPESFVALRVTLKGSLDSPGENPYLMTEFFKSGSRIGQKDMMVGSRFDEVKMCQDISVDVIPGYRWKEVDSVKCSFVMGEKALKFKNLKLQFFQF